MQGFFMSTPLIYLLIAAALAAAGAWLFWPEGGLYWRWQRNRMLSRRVLHEDALKHLFQCEMDGEKPTPQSLAGALNISANRAAEILAELQARELLEIQAGELRMTPAGRDYALRIIRAHRLYERYLADETGYTEVEWHSKAHLQEHRLNPDEVSALAASLGNPTHDPHGDPIPGPDGYLVAPPGAQPITSLALNRPARIVHLEDEPEAVYAQLVAEGLYVGQEVCLLEMTPQRVRLWGGGDEHVLAPVVAANIGVIPLQEPVPAQPASGQPLTALRPGQEARLSSLSPRLRGVERRRLMDLGLLPGTTISVEMVSAGGDPTAYRIRGALIALRKSQADQIFVCPPGEESAGIVDMQTSPGEAGGEPLPPHPERSDE
jgi:DtxR family transcriptional regulator, Mn-dependent transcriptional regulator